MALPSSRIAEGVLVCAVLSEDEMPVVRVALFVVFVAAIVVPSIRSRVLDMNDQI